MKKSSGVKSGERGGQRTWPRLPIHLLGNFPSRYARTSKYRVVDAQSEIRYIDSTSGTQSSVSEPPGRGPVPSPGINYTGQREA